MQKNKLPHQVFILIVGCYLLVNCNSINNGKNITPAPLLISQEVRITETTFAPTSTLAIQTPFPSPISTLETAIARQQVFKLFETNNNCRLPCWWGIIPGKTNWDDALEILAPISLKIDPYSPQKPAESVYVNVVSPMADVNVYGSYLSQDYFVENNLVTEITLNYNFDLAEFTYFKPFIREYGIPEQVYIHGYGEPQLDTWPFEIALFYPKQGMLLEYSGSPIIQNDNLVVCWGEEHFPVSIHLWKPDQTLTFDEIISRYYVPDSTDLPPYRSIRDVTINPDQFLDGLNNLQKELCLETPQMFWLSKK